MGTDSDIAEAGRAFKYVRKRKRELYGVDCPQCEINRPRTNPSKLLPGQRCKVDGYRDPRQRITDEQLNAIWAEIGYERVSNG